MLFTDMEKNNLEEIHCHFYFRDKWGEKQSIFVNASTKEELIKKINEVEEKIEFLTK
jgi:hypothetical protein